MRVRRNLRPLSIAVLAAAILCMGAVLPAPVASVGLPYKGKWRPRAYHPADAGHVAGWSAKYDYVTVR